MSLLAFFILVLGFYIVYNTSKRAVLQKNSIVLWIQKKELLSKITGTLLLVLSFYLYILQYGLATGIFIALVLLMVVSSLVIVLFPLKKTK